MEGRKALRRFIRGRGILTPAAHIFLCVEAIRNSEKFSPTDANL
jgi:hypothetical protein